MVIFTVVTATLVTLTGFVHFGIAQGQVNNNNITSLLTPQQKAVMQY
jgi:hypothetical protein